MTPPEVAAGALRVFYLFEVADSTDLSRLRTIGGEGLAPAQVPLRPHASSSYLQFPTPPLVANLPPIALDATQLAARVKIFDYGVVSVRLSANLSGPWNDVQETVARLRTDVRIAQIASDVSQRVVHEIEGALDDPHLGLVEDYTIVEINRFATPIDTQTLVAECGAQLASLLLTESSPLSPAEIDEVLRQRFAYYADDLTVVLWDVALVCDRRESADGIADILEFANSQLLELRTYDAQLDGELDIIYKMQPARGGSSLLGRREAEQAAGLRYLIVDVLELTDRATNALKVVGDAYYARIYRAATQRLGLADWQRQLDAKLQSVGEMYRFLVDQSQVRRDQFMELIIIVLIALELIVAVLALHH